MNLINYFALRLAQISQIIFQIRPLSHFRTPDLNKRVSSSIYLNIPNSTEILNAIYSLKNNKAVVHDDIPAFFL